MGLDFTNDIQHNINMLQDFADSIHIPYKINNPYGYKVYFFIINGKPRSGKDTFVQCCQSLLEHAYLKCCYNLSTVDYVKQLARENGWLGEKDSASREFLSNLKDVLSSAPFGNIIHRHLIEKINKTLGQSMVKTHQVFFIHSREPKDIEELKKKLNAITVLIRRPAVENNEVSNHADADVFNYQYDFEIYNTGTLEDLYNQARTFLKGNKII